MNPPRDETGSDEVMRGAPSSFWRYPSSGGNLLAKKKGRDAADIELLVLLVDDYGDRLALAPLCHHGGWRRDGVARREG